jgi:phage repressor protein C with HTH and peptisase S24 domain
MGDVRWIIEALEASGKTRRALGKAIGIDGSGVTRLLKGERELKAPEVSVIERFLNTRAPDDLLTEAQRRRLDEAMGEAPRSFDDPARGAAFAPCYGSLTAEDGVTVIRNGDPPVSQEAKPWRHARTRGLWCFAAVGEAMAPRFEPGETVWINPHRQPRAGDDVLLIEQREPAMEIYCLLRKLVRETPKFWTVRQHTPMRERDVAKDGWRIALVLPRE